MSLVSVVSTITNVNAGKTVLSSDNVYSHAAHVAQGDHRPNEVAVQCMGWGK